MQRDGTRPEICAQLPEFDESVATKFELQLPAVGHSATGLLLDLHLVEWTVSSRMPRDTVFKILFKMLFKIVYFSSAKDVLNTRFNTLRIRATGMWNRSFERRSSLGGVSERHVLIWRFSSFRVSTGDFPMLINFRI